MFQKTIYLDFYNHNINTLRVKQNDIGRTVEAVCTDCGKKYYLDPSAVRAYVLFNKNQKDSTFSFKEGVITENGTVAMELPSYPEPGKQALEILIVKSEDLNVERLSGVACYEDFGANVISTMPFYVTVVGSVVDSSEITSLSEFDALTNALIRLSETENHLRDVDIMLDTNEENRQNKEVERIINETARKEAESARDNAELKRQDNITGEEYRIANEIKRQDDITGEAYRIANEEVRITHETYRDEAEIKRQDNITGEAYRIANEQVREDNEDDRKEAETERQTGEKGEVYRIANEEIRVEAELKRQDNVTGEAYRQNEELNRKNNENIRIDNETAREEAEIKRQDDITGEAYRIANEAARMNAESNRIITFNNKLTEYTSQVSEITTDANAVIARLNEAVESGGIYQSEKGSANGVATLDENAIIPSGQLPFVSTIENALTSAGYIFDAQALATLISGLHVVHTGTEDPSNDLGKDGDIYMKIIVDDTEEGTDNQGGE